MMIIQVIINVKNAGKYYKIIIKNSTKLVLWYGQIFIINIKYDNR